MVEHAKGEWAHRLGNRMIALGVLFLISRKKGGLG